MTEIDKSYDKVDKEVMKSYELKREILKKEEDDLKEGLKTNDTKIKPECIFDIDIPCIRLTICVFVCFSSGYYYILHHLRCLIILLWYVRLIVRRILHFAGIFSEYLCYYSFRGIVVPLYFPSFSSPSNLLFYF